MKVNIRAEGFKFEELFEELDALNAHLGEAAVEGTKAIALVVERSMKNAYGKTGDYIADSIGHNVEMGRDQKSAVASVGVFHIDSVAAKHLKWNLVKPDEKGGVGQARMGITAPQAAWWSEFGTVHQPARPFIETGYLTSIKQQEEAFTDAINNVIDRVSKL